MQTRLENRPIFIYTWNPDWEQFQHLTLEHKISAFKAFVTKSQEHFVHSSVDEANAVCLTIAPDLVFTPPQVEGASEAYSFADNQTLERELDDLRQDLDERMLVISGAIQYTTENNNFYKVRSYVVAKNHNQTYDKKETTGPINIGDGVTVPMEVGQKSGVIAFHNLRIGLEICRDHENATLLNEIKQQPVDIHVLIANGQNIRTQYIATSKERNGIFIVCELEQEKQPTMMKKFEQSACYSTKPARRDMNNFRFNANARVLGRKVSIDLDQITSNDIEVGSTCVKTVLSLPSNKRVVDPVVIKPNHEFKKVAEPIALIPMLKNIFVCYAVGSPAIYSKLPEEIREINDILFYDKFSEQKQIELIKSIIEAGVINSSPGLFSPFQCRYVVSFYKGLYSAINLYLDCRKTREEKKISIYQDHLIYVSDMMKKITQIATESVNVLSVRMTYGKR